MLEEILPRYVASSEVFGDISGIELFPEEEAVIANAVADRRHEYTTARACARSALIKLGHKPEPILQGKNGAPQWPKGIVGSITHCENYRGVAVAFSTSTIAIGIDAEQNSPLPDDLIYAISTHEERSQLPSAWHVCWDRLLFSAKESVYKIWSPLTGKWLDYDDVSVVFEPRSGSFQATLREPMIINPHSAPKILTGRWCIKNKIILTAITVGTCV